MPCVGERERDHGGCAVGMAQGALDEPGIDASCEPMGGVGMAQGRDGPAGVGTAGSLCGGAAGPLDPGATHGAGRRRAGWLRAPGGGKEPGLSARGFPVGAQQSEGRFGEGDGAVLSPLSPVDMDLEAWAIDVRGLEGEGFMKPESHTVDGGAGDLVVQGRSRLEATPNFFNPEDGGEAVGGWSPQPSQGVPIALEDVLREAAEATGAEAQGRWGETIDVCAGQEVVWQFLFGAQGWRWAIERSQQADFADRGLLGTLSLAPELKRRNHGVTQWGPELSPFVR